jgi:hypothetical protein
MNAQDHDFWSLHARWPVVTCFLVTVIWAIGVNL